MEENSDGAQYEGSIKLGNIQSGDGRMFISRGLLPILGRYMYQAVGKVINENLLGEISFLLMSIRLRLNLINSNLKISYKIIWIASSF